MTQATKRIAENLAAVRHSMAEAAARSGRSVDQIRLVAVTKYISVERARSLVEAGCHDLGENRPQQLCDKAQQLRDLPIRWHLIGHLQRNKINRTLPHVQLLHSLDSTRLWQSVDQWAAQHGTRLPALIEVNISGDPGKHGFAPQEVSSAVQSAAAWPHVDVRGLMGMASLVGGQDRARRDFIALRQLRDQLVARSPPGLDLPDLSMGMSGDFVVAIEEGATLIRVGSALFEGVEP
jgi:pyridoxal phosphate enzyme (YggS family)